MKRSLLPLTKALRKQYANRISACSLSAEPCSNICKVVSSLTGLELRLFSTGDETSSNKLGTGAAGEQKLRQPQVRDEPSQRPPHGTKSPSNVQNGQQKGPAPPKARPSTGKAQPPKPLSGSGRQGSQGPGSPALSAKASPGGAPSADQAGRKKAGNQAALRKNQSAGNKSDIKPRGPSSMEGKRGGQHAEDKEPSVIAVNENEMPEGEILVEDWESIVSDKWITEELEAIDVGSYLGLPRNLLPEVFFESGLPVWEELHPRGGCRGLEEELEASKTDLVMYRASTHVVASEVAEKSSKKIYLVGPPSSGKSIAMAIVVAQMRAKGWLVMYIPEARQLTSGGFFNRHPEIDTWDTPEIAKLLLYYLVEGNPVRSDEVKGEKSGRTLRELAQQAIDSSDPHETVDIFLEAKAAVAAAPNALIAVDNYQALHVETDYGEWLSPTKRRKLEPDDLRVAAALKVLEQEDLPDGVVLCAANRSSSFSSRTRFPLQHGASIISIPRFSWPEWSAMSTFYSLTGATATLSDYLVKKAYFTMVANPTEFRKFVPLIAEDDEAGYAAFEAEMASKSEAMRA